MNTKPLLESFFDAREIVQFHLDSYNQFISKKLQRVVDESNLIEPNIDNYVVKMGRISLEKPRTFEADGSKRDITPMEARIRSRSYTAPVFLEMTPVQEGEEIEPVKVYIGELPVMIKSDLCHLHGKTREEIVDAKEDPDDSGGYFIINGNEKVLVMQEELAPNRVMVDRQASGVITAKAISVRQGYRTKIYIEKRKTGTFRISFPLSPKNLSPFVLIRALGIESDQDILNAFKNDKVYVNDILLNLEGIIPQTVDEAIDHIGKWAAPGQPQDYRMQRAQDLIDKYLLPHIGGEKSDRLRKAFFIVRMMEKAVDLDCGKRKEDDKDHYANKRLKMAGELMDDLFRTAFNTFKKDVKFQVERASARSRQLKNIKTLVRPDALTERIRIAMSTGQWTNKRNGVSQILERSNNFATISHLRRVTSPLSKNRPNYEARDLHATYWGRICCVETPEGPNCGLVKSLGLTVEISTEEDSENVEKILMEKNVKFDLRQGEER